MPTDESHGAQSPESGAAPGALTPGKEPSSAVPVFAGSDYAFGSTQPGHAAEGVKLTPSLPAVRTKGGASAPPPPPPPPSAEDSGDGEEEGMLRMSFLEHLEELRRRIFYALGGFAVAFLLSLTFCKELWAVVSAPAVEALQ